MDVPKKWSCSSRLPAFGLVLFSHVNISQTRLSTYWKPFRAVTVGTRSHIVQNCHGFLKTNMTCNSKIDSLTRGNENTKQRGRKTSSTFFSCVFFFFLTAMVSFPWTPFIPFSIITKIPITSYYTGPEGHREDKELKSRAGLITWTNLFNKICFWIIIHIRSHKT